MKREVNLTKRVQIPHGWRYCRVVFSANGRVKPDLVLVNEKRETHKEGVYYLEWREGAKRVRLSVGKDSADASARRQRKEAELNAMNNGVGVIQYGQNGHRSIAAAVTMLKLVRGRLAYVLLVSFFSISFCAMLCAVSFAQDPTKVEPSHYKLAFENESVQVVNVHYGPHEKSSLHAHMGGVVVVLTAGHLKFTDENGKSHEVFAKPGEARWYPPFKHKVENLGETSYNAVYIGIKSKHASGEGALQILPPEMDEQTRKLVVEALLAVPK